MNNKFFAHECDNLSLYFNWSKAYMKLQYHHEVPKQTSNIPTLMSFDAFENH